MANNKGSMTCQYDEIVGPVWPAESTLVSSLFEKMASSTWSGEAPERHGFVDPELWNDSVIMGSFAIEKPLRIVTYDNSKERTEHEEESFEHAWFALFLDLGRLLAQRRKFIHKELNTNGVLDLLRTSIASELVSLGLPVLQFRPVEKLVEKDEFLEEFARGRIRELRIDHLANRSVPPTTRLFNPDLDRDAILRETINHDNRHLWEIRAKAADDGDLSQARFLKGEIAAGEPSHLVREEDNEIITLQRTTPDRLQFGVHTADTRVVPTDEEKDQIVATVRGRRIKHKRTHAGAGQASLFSSNDDSNGT